MTRRECDVTAEQAGIYRVRRVFHFRNEVTMFVIAPPLEARLLLTPATFLAVPRKPKRAAGSWRQPAVRHGSDSDGAPLFGVKRSMIESTQLGECRAKFPCVVASYQSCFNSWFDRISRSLACALVIFQQSDAFGF